MINRIPASQFCIYTVVSVLPLAQADGRSRWAASRPRRDRHIFLDRQMNPVTEAKAVIQSHEEFAKAGDLDGVMTNIADGVVMLTAGASLIEGKEALREFYGGLLAAGRLDFGHDYSGAEVLGDAVVLHGVSRGTVTSPEGEVTSFTNNFIHVLRREADGKLRAWRAAFAPAQ